MKSKCRVLVTGAGSGVGQGIIKSLRLSELPITIIAADVNLLQAGLYRADESVLMPRVEDVKNINEIIFILEKYNVQVIMIGSEFDLKFFAEYKSLLEAKTNVVVVVASKDVIDIADDKWMTIQFLEKAKLPFPKTFLPKSLDDAYILAEKLTYPLILKSRRGTSSKNVHIVHTKDYLKKYYQETPSPILQQLIKMPSPSLGNEYTCSVFKTLEGNIIGPFIARRTIRAGTSWNIEVIKCTKLNKLLLEIGQKINFIGSLNIQLMMGNNGGIPFELNARFSGTTAVRSHFGFNEPEMALKNLFFGEKINNPSIRDGIVLRYNEEIFLDNVSTKNLSLSKKGAINRWF